MQWLWIFPAIGVVMLVIAGVLAWKAAGFRSGSVQGVALVTGYNEYTSSDSDGRSSRMYQPEMTLEGVTREDGSAISKTSSMGTSWKPYKVGSRLRVIFKLDDPEDFQIDSFGQLYFGPLICGAIGICFLGIGMALVFSMGGSGRSEVISEPAVEVVDQR